MQTLKNKGGNLTVPYLLNRGGVRGLVLNAGISPGLSSSATIQQTLTDLAIGHANDVSKTVAFAERLCPTVHVPGSVGRYKKFDDVNSFQIYDTKRGLGADPTRIQFAAEDEYYHCSPQGLEVTVDEEERNLAGSTNEVNQALLDEGKIQAVTKAAVLSYAYTRTNYVLANTTPIANRGNFSNPGIDPIDQIDEQLDALSLACGSINFLKVTMDVSAWRAIRSHPLVKKRLIGVQVSEISVEQLKTMLLFPVDLMVASISYTGTNQGPVGGSGASAGEQSGKKRLLAGNILIHYSVPDPTLYDPSAFKCFVAGQSNVQAVRSYMAPNGLYGGHIVDWSEDIEQTSAVAMARLQLS